MSEKKERIWELDALRGLCLLGMIAVHLCFDLQVFGGLYFPIPAWFRLMQEYGHILFILISGICATLATRTVRRGLIVFGAGLLVSYVTLMLEFLGGFDEAEVALVDKVGEGEALILILLGHGHDKAQVGAHEAVERALVAFAYLLGQFYLLVGRHHGLASDFLEVFVKDFTITAGDGGVYLKLSHYLL